MRATRIAWTDGVAAREGQCSGSQIRPRTSNVRAEFGDFANPHAVRTEIGVLLHHDRVRRRRQRAAGEDTASHCQAATAMRRPRQRAPRRAREAQRPRARRSGVWRTHPSRCGRMPADQRSRTGLRRKPGRTPGRGDERNGFDRERREPSQQTLDSFLNRDDPRSYHEAARRPSQRTSALRGGRWSRFLCGGAGAGDADGFLAGAVAFEGAALADLLGAATGAGFFAGATTAATGFFATCSGAYTMISDSGRSFVSRLNWLMRAIEPTDKPEPLRHDSTCRPAARDSECAFGSAASRGN